ncbi:MAG: cytochrome PufQ [Pseudomonadota bacterium]
MTTRQRRGTRVEYWVYFTLIFVLAIPFSFARWAMRLIAPQKNKRNRGVIARAKEQAHTVTPMIFSA